MSGVLQDFRHGLRLLGRGPGFSLIVVLTLALGIGANTAIFSVVYAWLLKPLPYAEPQRLVMVWQDLTARGGPAHEWMTPGTFADLAGRPDIFDSIAAIRGWQPTLTGAGDPEPLLGEQVSYEYFGALGVAPALGRNFAAADDVPGAARVAILSHDLWVRRFGSDPAVIGRRITLGGDLHEVVGVMPEGFRPIVVDDAAVWRPGRLNRATPSRGAFILRTVARVKPGIGIEQARAAARTFSQELQRTYPESNSGMVFAVVPLHEQVVGEFRTSLLVLLGAVGFVLLIACANVANLLLVRGSGRIREIGVRLALGASRGRVMRQLLTESVLLAGCGGALGLLLGMWGMAALVAVAPPEVTSLAGAHIAAPVLAFTAALSILTGLAFGLVPALQASRLSLTPALKDGGRGSAGGGGRRVRQGLVVSEVAIAMVLLVGSGLLLRTFLRLQSADLGFDPSGVLVGTVIPPQAAYPTREAQVAFFDRVLEGARALPGVQSAAMTSVLPLGGDSDMDVTIEGHGPTRPGEETTTWYRLVSADYLKTMGIALRRGRVFEAHDPAPSVVVNETAARRYWPGQDPLGRRVRFGRETNPWFTVVGIAADVSMRGPRGEPRIEMYLPYWHFTEPGMTVVLKTAGAPGLLAEPLRAMVRTLDPDMPVSGVGLMRDRVAESIAQPKFLALLVGLFAMLAMSLAAIGIYGVMSYAVAQRTAEIGVRMALGANRGSVFALVVRDGFVLAAAGLAIGLAAAALVARSLHTLLFAVGPMDPATFALTAVSLLAVALIATSVPARRATRVDPLTALRTE